MLLDLHKESDAQETEEWLASLDAVFETVGLERAAYLINQLLRKAWSKGIPIEQLLSMPYQNTLPADQDPIDLPEQDIASRVHYIIRWNAVIMVLKAGQVSPELGGHIATYASAATLYDIGFDHFFHAASQDHGGDLIYIQGHASPGVYARAFLEGRLKEQDLLHFRQEIEQKGLSSYPHPWLMPDFWQFPTVSMGLGPLQAIYQARFMYYLHHRHLLSLGKRKVWAFLGDGEMDEPESLGAITLASREKLDNLIFVVNCNLQRLDGPVRGNSKIIQELESVFLGAGWRVIKVVWSSDWDHLFQQDKQGLLRQRLETCVDGEFQRFKPGEGDHIRKHFFGHDPRLETLFAKISDQELSQMRRGGHDPKKVFAAYHAAVTHQGSPVVILAKTLKGHGMGSAGEGQNITHQQKKMNLDELKLLRDRFAIPIDDQTLETYPFYHPGPESAETLYVQRRRKTLGGYLPARRRQSEQTLPLPSDQLFQPLREGMGNRRISTTMAFVRLLTQLLKDPQLGQRVVPIVPDECRTFGMEGLFKQCGIYSPLGQLYQPEDNRTLMPYKESKQGQILQEGISEAGGFSSWLAAATSYSNHNLPLIPFFIYYSMFGFQRVGDLAWAAGDAQARGFLMGATAGRTTLAGEGLQHQDGHSHILASTIPNCLAYDPTFAYELAVIIQEGCRRMFLEQDNVFYYITLMNENSHHPSMPDDQDKTIQQGILKGLYPLKASKTEVPQGTERPRVQLLGSGMILHQVLEAADQLEQRYGIAVDVWSATSFNELRKEALSVERYNRLHPNEIKKQAYVTRCLHGKDPIIAATDYMRLYADQIRGHVDAPYFTLGTDGFGRSGTRKELRAFFEVDSHAIIWTALKALYDQGRVPMSMLTEAEKEWGANKKETPDPWTV